ARKKQERRAEEELVEDVLSLSARIQRHLQAHGTRDFRRAAAPDHGAKGADRGYARAYSTHAPSASGQMTGQPKGRLVRDARVSLTQGVEAPDPACRKL